VTVGVSELQEQSASVAEANKRDIHKFRHLTFLQAMRQRTGGADDTLWQWLDLPSGQA
jgi:hypothetical protein